MQLNTIAIDLTKCRHKLLVIKGDNGSGKTTLFNSISVLPDDNSCFIPGMEASKKIRIYDDFNGTEYQAYFVHGVKKDGSRETTKAYISKLINGKFQEMNPNGNISSYKDYIYSEFQLDSNFLALSQLSSEDRGLVDKKPAERKKFVTSIINTLEVYNGMYKILTKKSSLYKSMINSILAKINTIGDPNVLTGSLASVNTRIESLQKEIMDYQDRIAEAKSTIKLLDPTGDIRSQSEVIYRDLQLLSNEYNLVKNEIDRLNPDIPKEELSDRYNKTVNEISKLESHIESTKNNISSLLQRQDESYKSMNAKIEKLKSIASDKNKEYYESNIQALTENIENQKAILAGMGLLGSNVTKDEFITGLNILEDIRTSIVSLQERFSYDVIQTAIRDYLPSGEYPDVETMKDQVDGIVSIIDQDSMLLRSYLDQERLATKLEDRPRNCSIDSCPFIKDAVEAVNSGNLEKIADLQRHIDDNIEIMTNIKMKMDKGFQIIDAINLIQSFLKRLNGYKSILSKLPNGLEYIDRNHILNRILSNDTFQDIHKLYSQIDSANILEEYKINQDSLEKITAEYKIYLSKEDIVKEIQSDIDSIDRTLKSIEEKLTDARTGLESSNNKLTSALALEAKISRLIDDYSKLDDVERRKNEVLDKFDKINGSITKIKEVSDEGIKLTHELDALEDQLVPLTKERDDITHALRMGEEYNKELQEYKSNYDKIETVKYYTSPSTGIQTIFMELYMHKILSMANDLLQMVFEGKFVLQPFIINESEFRIPCLGQGLINDDISSMSTSQKCIISMILSFSLLIHSSSRYNILKIDEIDGGLDTQNRLHFVSLLDYLMNYIGCQQCIMISHNSELDLSQADVIILRDATREFGGQGNIIYDYNRAH